MSTCIKVKSIATILSVATLFFLPAAANAALIATSSTPAGGLKYEGLGETTVGSGVGTGRLTLGDCSFDGANTTCLVSGAYVERNDSTNAPGAQGNFTFSLVYAGNGNAPTLAQSVSPGDDELVFFDIGDAVFTLDLFPSAGGSIRGVFPADPFSDSIGFSSFTGPDAICTGLSAGVACSIGQVGLTDGAVLNASIQPFVFSIPDSVFMNTTPVPLPAGFLLMLTGGLALGGAAVKKKKTAI